MKEKGIVISVKEKYILVSPLLSEACSSCGGNCEKNHTVFEAQNSQNLQLKAGDQVMLEISNTQSAIQGLLALLVPFLCAIAGYFTAVPFMSLFGIEAKDGIKALFVLLFLFLSSLVIFIISRTRSNRKSAQIVQLLS